ncbi:MAG TPA: MATE family efflux transporter, partial [Novosphingobium sp.]|nr:MATE family efflux transporter [Novosphingobium sp.]
MTEPTGENPLTDSPVAAPSPARPRPPVHGDLTQGPILKTLLLFSIPTLISNLLQTLNGTINAIWVGRLIGNSALAATANANLVMFLLFAAVFGFGMATTVRVGHAFGAGDVVGARRVIGTGLGFCLMVSAVVGIAGSLLARPLLHALATPAASLEEALAYLRVVFITFPLATLSLVVSMGLRGAGDAKTPLYAMILTVLVDAALNPLLIRGAGPVPGLGIAGSAMATAFANALGSAFMIARAYARALPLRLGRGELRYLLPAREELGFVLAKGLPMGAQMLLISSAGLVMVGLVNREGMMMAAAYGASLQIWNYLQMPSFAISSAVSAMVAQNVGAGNHLRVGRITRAGVFSNIAFTTAMSSLIVLGAHPLLVLFLGSGSPAVPLASHMQLIVTWSFVLVG